MSERDDLKLLCQNAVGFSDVSLAPEVVLGLIGDLDVSNNVGRALGETLESVCESRDALVRVNKQLKTENETLAKIFNDAPNLPDTDVEWLEKTRLLEAQNEQLKAGNEAPLLAMSEILRVTPMGVEAFDIAALVLGELSGAALGQGEQFMPRTSSGGSTPCGRCGHSFGGHQP